MLKAVSTITMYEDVSLITVTSYDNEAGFVSKVLTPLAKKGINVDMISLTASKGGESNLSFTIADEDMADALIMLGGMKKTVSSGNVKISFYGEAMKYTPGAAAEVFALFSELGVATKVITTSTVDISILIDSHHISDVLDRISKESGIAVEKISMQDKIKGVI